MPVIAVDRKQDSSFFDSAFIALRLVLGNAHSDQGSRQTANHPAGARASQCGYDRSRCDE